MHSIAFLVRILPSISGMNMCEKGTNRVTLQSQLSIHQGTDVRTKILPWVHQHHLTTTSSCKMKLSDLVLLLKPSQTSHLMSSYIGLIRIVFYASRHQLRKYSIFPSAYWTLCARKQLANTRNIDSVHCLHSNLCTETVSPDQPKSCTNKVKLDDYLTPGSMFEWYCSLK